MHTNIDRVKDLERQIDELKRRSPSHSVRSMMLQQFDELEKELDGERKRAIEEESTAKADGPAGL